MENYNIRLKNRLKVRDLFKSGAFLKASDISRQSGLSVMTVNRVLKEMTKEHEVSLRPVNTKTGGRPHKEYRYNNKFSLGLVIFAYSKGNDIVLSTVLVNAFGNVIDKTMIKVKQLDQKYLDDLFMKYLKKYKNIDELLLGFPGVHIYSDKIDSNLITFDKDYIKIIEDQYKIRVEFISDINAAVYGRYIKNKTKNSDCYVAIFAPKKYPKSVGTVLNGKIHFGLNGYAGSIDYIPSHKYESGKILFEELAEISTFATALLAPKKIIIYGSRINLEMIKLINFRIRRTFNNNIDTLVDYECSIKEDYDNGVIAIITERLEESYYLYLNNTYFGK